MHPALRIRPRSAGPLLFGSSIPARSAVRLGAREPGTRRHPVPAGPLGGPQLLGAEAAVGVAGEVRIAS
jgi:hypothetical protein